MADTLLQDAFSFCLLDEFVPRKILHIRQEKGFRLFGSFGISFSPAAARSGKREIRQENRAPHRHPFRKNACPPLRLFRKFPLIKNKRRVIGENFKKEEKDGRRAGISVKHSGLFRPNRVGGGG
ncbi:hypothetical protein B4135_2437 [Caldibacillus debilis]|uniref:Uncharacterized protein n=1 Tax=Caldibacillus debilis TaxID=301148 RepID=A0A150M054_9BACI|nr:hypothetical protein B4135_2437 [Caldibacillus debilis]